MNKNKELFGKDPLPSVIENPFDVKSIEGIHIYYGKYPISGGPYFTGKVQFKKVIQEENKVSMEITYPMYLLRL